MNEQVPYRIELKWRAIATFFWTGYFPIMPATACSLAVTIVAWLLGASGGPYYLLVLAIVVVLGVPAASVAEREFGRDGRRIVIDEVAGQMIAFIAFPATATTYIGGFLLFRVFDVLKPFPAGRSQRLIGGVGVMADDVIAGIYANLALRLILSLG